MELTLIGDQQHWDRITTASDCLSVIYLKNHDRSISSQSKVMLHSTVECFVHCNFKQSW